jgi:acetyl-CoA C-acetyltransferase
MAEAYVIDAVRSAVGKRNGSLSGVHPIDLGARLARRSSATTSIPPRSTTWWPAAWTPSARRRATSAGCPGWPPAIDEAVPGVTVDRQCGSSQQAIPLARRRSWPGTADLILAGGMQNMSAIPISSAMTVAEQFGFTSPTNESKNWLERYGIKRFRSSAAPR